MGFQQGIDSLLFIIMMMILALLRFFLFVMPTAFLSGLSWILFDRQEVITARFDVRRLRDPQHKEKIIKSYLEKCYKNVHKNKE